VRALLHELMPAAATSMAQAVVLGWRYAASPVITTLLGLEGAQNYAAMNYKFFHAWGVHSGSAAHFADISAPWWGSGLRARSGS
jgi:hypothetical protein